MESMRITQKNGSFAAAERDSGRSRVRTRGSQRPADTEGKRLPSNAASNPGKQRKQETWEAVGDYSAGNVRALVIHRPALSTCAPAGNAHIPARRRNTSHRYGDLQKYEAIPYSYIIVGVVEEKESVDSRICSLWICLLMRIWRWHGLQNVFLQVKLSNDIRIWFKPAPISDNAWFW